MASQFTVYLSSTLDDLREERKVVVDAISDICVIKQTYRADDQRSVDACLADVQACDLYVGILAQCYGSIAGIEGKSFTELEYEACVRNTKTSGKPDIPRLMFIKSTEAGIPEKHIDAISNPATAMKIAAFRARAGNEQTPYFFSSIEKFGAELRISVKEKADKFQRTQLERLDKLSAPRLFEGLKPRNGQLAQFVLGCVPGTDAHQRNALVAGSPAIVPFDLSPDAPDYLAKLDAGLSTGQSAGLLLTADSLRRLTQSGCIEMVAAAINMLRQRSNLAILVCEGVDSSLLPGDWCGATVIELPAGTLDSANEGAGTTLLLERIRAINGQITPEVRFALPYMVIAPTLAEAAAMDSWPDKAFSGFQSATVRTQRSTEFLRAAAASKQQNPRWPSDTYGTERHHWKCFGKDSRSAEDLVSRSIERVNNASDGTRAATLLKRARLIPRRYNIDEYLLDQWGSRQVIEMMLQRPSLILIDEVALLDYRLRTAADELLSGTRNAVVAISPFDPAHTGIKELLEEISYLRVGQLVSRFKNDLDPRCELAVNSINRVERWLSATLPDLVASAGAQEIDPTVGDLAERDMSQ